MSIQLHDLVGENQKMTFSPFCWRTRMSLLHKGVDFETVPWRFSDKSTTEASGTTTVPVINDNDQWVCDSWEIAKYLDKQYADKPALLSGSEGEANAKLVEAICRTAILPVAVSIAAYQVYNILDEASKPYFRESRENMLGKTLEDINVTPETGKENLSKALSAFNMMLESSAYLGGDDVTYADYILYGFLKWMDVVSKYVVLDMNSPVGQWFTRIDALYDGHGATAPTVRD